MNEFKKQHELHAILIGVTMYYFTNNVKSSLIAGGGAYAYMSYFGHGESNTVTEHNSELPIRAVQTVQTMQPNKRGIDRITPIFY